MVAVNEINRRGATDRHDRGGQTLILKNQNTQRRIAKSSRRRVAWADGGKEVENYFLCEIFSSAFQHPQSLRPVDTAMYYSYARITRKM